MREHRLLGIVMVAILTGGCATGGESNTLSARDATAVGELAAIPASSDEREWLMFFAKLYERTPEYEEILNRTEELRREFAEYYWYVENLTAQNMSIDNKTREEFFSRFSAFVLSQEELIKAWERAFDGRVLRNAYYSYTTRLLESLKVYYPEVDRSALDSMEYVKVLVIPSGAIYGLDEDDRFRQALENFVAGGGVLIVFAQQGGYEFRALPGGKLSGYGWSEDISSHQAIVTDPSHPIFAGQNSPEVGANIDGYFTQWPENARILMRKKSSRWPVMVEYSYGKGRVIAMTLYTDWAFATRKAFSSELALIRDLLTWAENPDSVPVYAPGDIAMVPVNVTSRVNVSSRSVVFIVVDPEKRIIANLGMNLSLAPGESRVVEFEYSMPGKTGIYLVDYALLNSSGSVVQVTFEAAGFAVSGLAEHSTNPA